MKSIIVTATLASLLVMGCKKKEEQPAPEASASVAAPKGSANAAGKRRKGPEPIPAPPDVAAPPANAQKTESGLAFVVLTPGTGTEHPTDDDRVSVHYTGWTKDGEMFDSSVARGRPQTFAVTRVVKGWTEGLKLMTKGEKRRFWIPAELAYGEKPMRPGAPSGQLTFDVELIDIFAAPKTPEDVAKPPATAKKTKSGLAYRVLTPGTGTEHPKEKSTVSVNYTGWTTDGKMFDSSVTRGRPASFALDQVIPGWTEGVQLMVTGEKTRFWIPEDLAYKGRPGAPAGMLVFDIELVSIREPKAGASSAHPGGPRPGGAGPKPIPPAPKPASTQAAPTPAAPAAPTATAK